MRPANCRRFRRLAAVLSRLSETPSKLRSGTRSRGSSFKEVRAFSRRLLRCCRKFVLLEKTGWRSGARGLVFHRPPICSQPGTGMNSGELGTFMGSVADDVRRTPRRSEPRFMDRRNFPGSFAQRSASSLRRLPLPGDCRQANSFRQGGRSAHRWLLESNPEIACVMNLVSMLRTDPFSWHGEFRLGPDQ